MDGAVQAIRDRGYTVRFRHWRPRKLSEKEARRCPHCGKLLDGVRLQPYRRGQTEWEPAPRGGVTYCEVFRDGEVIVMGRAECSMADSFCYRIGRTISAGRALKKLLAQEGAGVVCGGDFDN